MSQTPCGDRIVLIYLRKRQDWCLKQEILDGTGVSKRRLRTYLTKLTHSGLVRKAPDLSGDMRKYRYKASSTDS